MTLKPWPPDAFDAMIFDMDDTLYPESAYVLSGFRAVARWGAVHLGIPEETGYQELEALFLAGIHGRTFNAWLENHGIDPGLFVSQLVDVYRQHVPEIEPFDDARPLLTALHEYGYRVGLLSDGYLDVQKKKFAALKLDAYFDAVVFSDAYGREQWKPNPVPYRAVAQQLGVQPGKAVYVADNPKKDFKGARGVGMASIRILRPHGVYAHLQPEDASYAPDSTVGSLAELQAAILQPNTQYNR